MDNNNTNQIKRLTQSARGRLLRCRKNPLLFNYPDEYSSGIGVFMSKITLHLFCAGLLFCLYSVHAMAAEDSETIKQCAQEKVAFDGIQPLKYADITGEANTHIPLWHQHPVMCTSADEAQCKGKAYLVPGDTVAVANTCGDYAHVQYIGEKTVSYGWVEESRLKGIVNQNSSAENGNSTVNSEASILHYTFQLTKGEGTPVCEAFLQRLNQSGFYGEDHSPYCGLPENDKVPGFSVLKHKWISTAQVNKLYDEVNLLIYHRAPPKDYELLRQPDGSWRKFPVVPQPRFLDKYLLSTFVFDPQIDINNDGEPDNVMIWNTDYRDHPHCGDLIGRFPQPAREGQSALVMANGNTHVDMAKTSEIFGHPDGGYWHDSRGGDSKPFFEKIFRPIGYSVSIFGYRQLYYFNTFYDDIPNYGDINDQRKGDLTLKDTLGVFIRKDRHTHQVCEYRLHVS